VTIVGWVDLHTGDRFTTSWLTNPTRDNVRSCTTKAPNLEHNECVSPRLLSPAELRDFVAEVPEWSVESDTLTRRFSFATFGDAMAFFAAMTEPSESMNHHPTWTNTYNRVEVRLTTHDVDGLSDLDVEWARIAEREANRLPQQR
jgi:4a-hydroxytetrahydrobiopterin dehydratase